MARTLKRIAAAATWVLAVLLALSYQAHRISPADFILAEYLALATLYLAFANAFAAVAWGLALNWRGALPFIALCSGYTVNGALFQFRQGTTAQGGKSIRILTYNVQNFTLLAESETAEHAAGIVDYVRSRQPAIACFQEFYTKARDKQQIVNDMMGIGFTHAYFNPIITMRKYEYIGMAIFSRFPIISQQAISFGQVSQNSAMFADVVVGNDTLRIFNVHLQSNRLPATELDLVRGEAQGGASKAVSGVFGILSRLKIGATLRARQAECIARYVRESPYPVVLCGDFNDPPSTYAYATVANTLTDTYREAGSGISATYAGPIPGIRIDNILVSPHIHVEVHRVEHRTLSDHYPVLAEVRLP